MINTVMIACDMKAHARPEHPAPTRRALQATFTCTKTTPTPPAIFLWECQGCRGSFSVQRNTPRSSRNHETGFFEMALGVTRTNEIEPCSVTRTDRADAKTARVTPRAISKKPVSHGFYLTPKCSAELRTTRWRRRYRHERRMPVRSSVIFW